MNADQLKGQWVQFKGDLKEQWGKFTDNDLEEIAGIYEGRGTVWRREE